MIRQKQGSKELHINIAKACKAELVSTYESKPWHSPITLPLSATRALQPCATVAVSIRRYCLIERLVEQEGDQSPAATRET